MASIKDKIKKLLSLATSPNENEAQAAMLKARELMAKNKLSDADFEDPKDEGMRSLVVNDVKWTTDSGKVWMTSLCKLIAENYCCVSAWGSFKGKRTFTLEITGIGEDVDLCVEVIKFAVKFIEKKVKILQRKNINTDPKTVESSYAKGFIVGLEFAYEEQQEQNEQEWGLVMVVPKEVQDFADSLGTRNVKTKKSGLDPMIAMQGKKDGQEFNPNTLIGTA